ncbi:MAG: acetyl-CoA hydrolase/transferase C-terminal domain-containing protein [Acidobacteriota bacterium]
MAWIDGYKAKLCSADEAVSRIKSNDWVWLSGNAAAPFLLMEALGRRAPELQNVTLSHVLLMGEDPLSKPGMEKAFHHNSLFVGPADRPSVNDGRSAYVPIHLHMIPKAIRTGACRVDVAMIQCSPPDEHGFMSLGLEVMAQKAAVEMAKTVIVQVNDQMPRTLGDSFLHVSKAAHIVEHSFPLLELRGKEATEVERKIGALIAEMIPDGATLQMGIGGIPDAVLTLLEGKRDLGIHTEMISDGLVRAMEQGIITGNKKTLHPGKVVATFILGTRKLYDFVHDNPLFEVHPVDHTNDPFIIAQNDNMVAINSALEVDLTGQVCSDSIGTYIYSGFGGQLDFIRGAAASKGGKPIIALPSTAKQGTMSRIVPKLKEGSGVVTTRADVHYVVTEHGATNLWGKNLSERAKALIAIADPAFKETLEKEARERHLI